MNSSVKLAEQNRKKGDMSSQILEINQYLCEFLDVLEARLGRIKSFL